VGKLLADDARALLGSTFNPLARACGVAAVDNAALERALLDGAAQLRLGLDLKSAKTLVAYEGELLRWNKRINLVGRASTPMEIMEKHFLDSLAAAPEIASAATLIDIGAGAGFPGVPLKMLSPKTDVTLVDSTGKKVAFMRHAIATLGVGPGIHVRHARAQGSPAKEKLPQAEVAISRALAALPQWLKLAFFYVVPGGRVIAMLSQATDSAISAAAEDAGAALISARKYELPFSRAARTIAVFERSRSAE
jgi:16S rRNA (guanine527-N7)-methyltransferase